jgi:hypothetical protein
MIATTEYDAYSQMAARIRDIANSAAMETVVGYKPEVRYDNQQYKDDPRRDKLWMRFAIVQAGEKTRTLGKPSRVTYHGTAGVQLFVPLNDTNAAARGRQVADLLLSGLQASTPSVDFYKPGIKDMPQVDGWWYKRVFATYNFTQYQGS